MALPKIEVPTYELELPISKKKIKYRPFLVKEQKILLMAMESNDAKTIQNSVIDILDACILTPDFPLNETPIIDVEYIFINLRAKSVGEIVESKYRCNNDVDDGEGGKKPCGNTIETKVNLTHIKPVVEKEVNPEIKLTDKIMVKMRYPNFSIIQDSTDTKDISKITMDLIASCIEYIFDGEQFYYANETTNEELVNFIEMLSQEQFEKMEEFFNNMPKMKQKMELKCNKCGFVHDFELEGLESFFG
jgi:hypothetical protein